MIWADHRFTLGHGRAFALHVAAYTVGRAWIESLRIDTANHILGLHLNDLTPVMLTPALDSRSPILMTGVIGLPAWTRTLSCSSRSRTATLRFARSKKQKASAVTVRSLRPA